MSFIDKIKIENTDYDIQDTEARDLIEKCLTEESDPTVPKYVKEITQEKITEWDNKSNFSGQYDDLQGLPDLSRFALESDIPKDYLKEIPAEYITEDELNEALENMPSGSAIPEITENTNIFDLETGVYYVNAGVTLASGIILDGGSSAITTMSKSILIVENFGGAEYGFWQVYFTLAGVNAENEEPNGDMYKVGTYHGISTGIAMGNELQWITKAPTFITVGDMEFINSRATTITSTATDEQTPTAKAVYDYVNSAIGTALDGEY